MRLKTLTRSLKTLRQRYKLGYPAASVTQMRSVPRRQESGHRGRRAVSVATSLQSPANDALRCISHCSTLHRSAQHAALAIAPHCIRHRSLLPAPPLQSPWENPPHWPAPVKSRRASLLTTATCRGKRLHPLPCLLQEEKIQAAPLHLPQCYEKQRTTCKMTRANGN